MTMPNCIAKINKTMQVFVGDEIENILNTSQLQFTRPFDRGYLVNWNIERDIWQRIFDSSHMNSSTDSCGVIVTVPPFCPDELQADMNEVLFEEFGFQSALCRPAPWFSAYEYYASHSSGSSSCSSEVWKTESTHTASNESPKISKLTSSFPECSLVIDSGFSFSHCMPFVDGKCIKHACKRVNIGGKLLTNYLKELVSYRQWNVMDEFLLINQVKEELSFVSSSFEDDLTKCFKLRGEMTVPKKISSHTGDEVKVNDSDDEEDEEYLRKFFVMPDFHTVMRGFVKQEGDAFEAKEQILTMESERFSVPELLFRPSDIGIHQAGIAEAAGQSIAGLHDLEAGLCVRNVILTGGNSGIPNFRSRFESDFLPLVPSHWADSVNVFSPPDPSDYAWKGAARFAEQELSAGTICSHMVSKKEYMEYGHSIC
eukprot:CAMPEP_0185039266 /NCGR_PEP_ID=MMETSP1103-20130426/35961_1 /TAXON_ID=36769 /ORGANISM="Paraphysomonas bandaiensis, Strain Caron Lab Isolate" /LENGTH=426 /DNA_ID=CAMNT_0027578085 /DNA_START=17 /DNA_END=1294 /DNA_ORIENTATION=-